MTVNPVMRYPPAMRPWWFFPPSLDPHVTLAIPIVISLNPYVIAARWMTAIFENDVGWRDANHHLGCRRDDSQRAGKNQSNQSLRNHNMLSLSEAQNANPIRRLVRYQALLRALTMHVRGHRNPANGVARLIRWRQSEIECRTGPRCRLHPHSTAMRLDDFLAECESKSVPWVFVPVQALEHPEYAVLEFRVDAGTVVCDGEYPVHIHPFG